VIRQPHGMAMIRVASSVARGNTVGRLVSVPVAVDAP